MDNFSNSINTCKNVTLGSSSIMESIENITVKPPPLILFPVKNELERENGNLCEVKEVLPLLNSCVIKEELDNEEPTNKDCLLGNTVNSEELYDNLKELKNRYVCHKTVKSYVYIKRTLPEITKELVIKLPRCILPEKTNPLVLDIKMEVEAENIVDNPNMENLSSEFDAADNNTDGNEKIKNLTQDNTFLVKRAKRRRKQSYTHKFKCNICGIELKKKEHLEEHIILHGEKNFTTHADSFESFIQNNFPGDIVKCLDIENLICNICKKISYNKTRFLSHLVGHRDEKKFVCNTCGKSFIRINYLNLHMQTHSDNTGECTDDNNEMYRKMTGKYKCNICGLKMMKKRYLLPHITAHTESTFVTHNDNIQSFIQKNLPKEIATQIDIENLNCNFCKKAFTVRNRFFTHVLSHSSDKKYVCHICGKSFMRKGFFNFHLSCHINVKQYKCYKCCQVLKSEKSLSKHTMHCCTKIFSCSVCDKLFREKHRLKEHSLIHSSKKDYACKICGKSFASLNRFNAHFKSHFVEIKKYNCDICHKTFMLRNTLLYHLKAHSNIKNYICNICNMPFKFKQNLKVHLMVHNEVKDSICSFCQKSFNTKRKLYRHLLIHSDIKSYICNVCKISFKRKKELSSHLLSHTNERSFFCDICKKGFKYRVSLQTHLLIHEGVKNHICTICDKVFRQVGHLSSHLKRHQGIKNFICDICGKAFTHKIDVSKHLQVHDDIKDYSCALCQKSFRQKVHLSAHLLYYHFGKVLHK